MNKIFKKIQGIKRFIEEGFLGVSGRLFPKIEGSVEKTFCENVLKMSEDFTCGFLGVIPKNTDDFVVYA